MPALATQPTSTLNAETANNTSACSSSSYAGKGKADPSYCTVSQISQLTTLSSNTLAETQVLNPIPGHVSATPIKTSYLYSGAKTRIIAAYQPWFGPEGTASNDCVYLGPGGDETNSAAPCTGYSENVALAISKQHTTMHNLGFTDVTPDWYGNCDPSTGCTNDQILLNQTVIDEAADLSKRASGYLYLMVTIDQGLITAGMTKTSYSGFSPGCPKSTATSSCVITVLEAAYDYIDHNWGRQFYYSTDPVSGYPMTLTFIGESEFPNVCWDATLDTNCDSNNPPVWSTLKSYMSKYVTPYKIVEENTFGEVDGAYAWPQGLPYDNSQPGSQFCWQYTGNYVNGCPTYNYIANFYSAAQTAYQQNNQTIQMGTLYAGFDGSNNNWNNNLIARQCGQLFPFLGTAITQAGYNKNNQLPWLLVATWNDYAEGTNIENGIDNCWRLSTPTVNGSILSWSTTALPTSENCPPPSDSSCASPTTINQFKIWYGTGAGDLSLAEQGILPRGTYCIPSSGIIKCSFDLKNATYPPPSGSTWNIYIQQIGAALIFDQINGDNNGNGSPGDYSPTN